jgi:glycosyltransferase involved in cell wall biosynthesis
MSNKYDCIHTHEEAALMGCLMKKIFNIPLIYDMHSSIPQQLENFKITHNKYLIGIAQEFENFIIRHSDAVIVICPHLEQTVHLIDERKYVQLIENTPLSDSASVVSHDAVKSLQHQLQLENAIVVLYTGTMEPYQGIDLLLEGIPRVVEKFPSVKFVLVGGETSQINSFRDLAKSLQIDNHVIFIGKRPPEEMPAYMEMSDVLVSPRNTGTNTPLKLYSYLKSGKPIVATNLLTHTQVLDNQVAVLTDPESQSFADGIIQVLSNRQFAETLGRNARNLADSKYSNNAFLVKTEKIYNYISSSRRTC